MEIDISIFMVTSLSTKRKVHLLKFNYNIMALLFDIETAVAREVYDEISLSCTSKALFQSAFGPRQICMVIWLCVEVIVKRHRIVFSLEMYCLIDLVKSLDSIILICGSLFFTLSCPSAFCEIIMVFSGRNVDIHLLFVSSKLRKIIFPFLEGLFNQAF